MDGPFDPPPDHPWIRVSPRLARMRRTMLLAPRDPGRGRRGRARWPSPRSPPRSIVAAGRRWSWLAWGWLSIGRNLRSWGYAERPDDLVITHGAMFKKLTVVPYGRMQLVDVEAGPIERSFGLVHVKLHTAAATTDAKVCGLLPATASELRDRLTQLGEAHASGL